LDAGERCRTRKSSGAATRDPHRMVAAFRFRPRFVTTSRWTRRSTPTSSSAVSWQRPKGCRSSPRSGGSFRSAASRNSANASSGLSASCTERAQTRRDRDCVPQLSALSFRSRVINSIALIRYGADGMREAAATGLDVDWPRSLGTHLAEACP
jgi:hypothetical protein